MSELVESASRLGRLGKWFGITGAFLCGLALFAILGLHIAATGLSPGDQAGSVGLSYLFGTIVFPLIILTGIVSILGTFLSLSALRRGATANAKFGLILSLASFGLVVVCFVRFY